MRWVKALGSDAWFNLDRASAVEIKFHPVKNERCSWKVHFVIANEYCLFGSFETKEEAQREVETLLRTIY